MCGGRTREYFEDEPLCRACEDGLKAHRDEKARGQALRQRIVTSSSSCIAGRKVKKQIRLIRVVDHRRTEDAEGKFLEKLDAAGADGAINVQIRHYDKGYISIQGDAVTLESYVVPRLKGGRTWTSINGDECIARFKSIEDDDTVHLILDTGKEVVVPRAKLSGEDRLFLEGILGLLGAGLNIESIGGGS
jgi:hypothetical protein